MEIGLYFGSFNPIHVGHLIIASYARQTTSLQQVWLVVSPHNPLKHSAGLLNEYHRLHFVRLAIEEDLNLKVTDVEFHLPKPSYTVHTLAYLAEKYPDHQFSIIMGGDSFQNLHKWKNFEWIVKNYSVFVYNRPGFEISNHVNARLTIADAPLLEISATQIRSLIKDGKSIRYIVPDKVREEIEKGGYYKK